MPRSLRVFVEGGIYHVYNRFASGEPVFADPEEALNEERRAWHEWARGDCQTTELRTWH
jgi:hypothetical protein